MRVRPTPVPLLALLLPVAALAAACSSDVTAQSTPEKAAHARFRLGTAPLPGFLDVPFPSDAYMKEGRFTSPLPLLDRTFKKNADVLAAQLAQTSGWSRIA